MYSHCKYHHRHYHYCKISLKFNKHTYQTFQDVHVSPNMWLQKIYTTIPSFIQNSQIVSKMPLIIIFRVHMSFQKSDFLPPQRKVYCHFLFIHSRTKLCLGVCEHDERSEGLTNSSLITSYYRPRKGKNSTSKSLVKTGTRPQFYSPQHW